MESVRIDVMKEDGCHQNIPFMETANIQKHKMKTHSKNEISWNDTT